MIERSMW